jgi:hypothetical protein
MLRISAVIAVLTLIGTAAVGVSVAHAQSSPKPKACSFNLEYCLAACNKSGGRRCEDYCDRRRRASSC